MLLVCSSAKMTFITQVVASNATTIHVELDDGRAVFLKRLPDLEDIHVCLNGVLTAKDMIIPRLLGICGSDLIVSSDGAGASASVSSLMCPVIGKADGKQLMMFANSMYKFISSSNVKTTAKLAREQALCFMGVFTRAINNTDGAYDGRTLVSAATQIAVGMGNEALAKLMGVVELVCDTCFKKIGMYYQLMKDVGGTGIIKELGKLLNNIESYDTFRANPYSAYVPRKVTFGTVDMMARAFGVGFDLRLLHNLKHRLFEKMQEGHTCFALDTLVTMTCMNTIHADIRACDAARIANFIESTPGAFVVYVHPETMKKYVYLAHAYKIESGLIEVLEKMIDMSLGEHKLELCSRSDCERYIGEFETQKGLVLNGKQKEAVIASFTQDQLFIATGYPGTGKSSIVACMCYVADKIGKNYVLCAPTGKASMRLGRKAQTIHRLLNLVDCDESNGAVSTGGDGLKKLAYDIVIVDEVSMMDLHLSYLLLKSCHKNTKVLFLGDSDQLPSVRYGNVLKDLIDSGVIGNVHLTKIYRQDSTSTICKLANSVIKGKMPKAGYLNSSDVEYIEASDYEKIRGCVSRLFDKHGGDLCILIPTKKGDVGTFNMNNVIHKQIFGENSMLWMPGEKVMCTKNIYSKNEKGEINIDKCAFNGQCGLLRKVNKETMDVDFEQGVICVGKQDIDKAYCCTVHKSQGSEYDHVVIVLHESQGACLYRQLLYTGITRAKKKLYIISSSGVLKRCIAGVGKKRCSMLTARLQSIYEVEHEQ